MKTEGFRYVFEEGPSAEKTQVSINRAFFLQRVEDALGPGRRVYPNATPARDSMRRYPPKL